ncbi:MAG: energy transducer TonB [Amphritea sp.]|nr:energy transducer TonB [Amphritea sp.]
MNSLLATLLELRIFIVAIFLSGAVHLTLIGGGWLADEESPKLSGQSLAIRVTASRSDVDTVIEKISDNVESAPAMQEPENSESSVLKPLKSQRPQSSASASESSEYQTVSPILSKTIGASQALKQTQSINETKINKESAEVFPSPESEVRLGQRELTKVMTEVLTEVLTEEPAEELKEELIATAQQAIPAPEAIRAAPLYQSNPAFRIPPQPPKYPRLARKRGIEGQVVLRADIGPAGDVLDLLIEQSSGSELLDQAARKAVQQWQFVPGQTNGVAVASYVRIPVDFVLEPH